MEAMKMEHRLTAEVSGVVNAVHVAQGDQVAADTVILDIEEQ
jgi:geranyl-CoA carboxylase alpha subunit